MNLLCKLRLHKWKIIKYPDYQGGEIKCERCNKRITCKCGSFNVTHFAGIGADGINCNVCDRIL